MLYNRQKEKKMENENVLRIYKYGEDVLKLKAKEIENLDGKIADLINGMAQTLHTTYSAVGLAAPQVGESLRLSVIDLSMGEKTNDLIVLINPEIIESEGIETGDEGCLSLPGISLSINRAAKIFLKNFDMNGKEIRREIDGYLARVIQHELDHLDGTLIIDRISSLKRQFVKKEIKRLQKDGKW
jgi:peptide deformylase